MATEFTAPINFLYYEYGGSGSFDTSIAQFYTDYADMIANWDININPVPPIEARYNEVQALIQTAYVFEVGLNNDLRNEFNTLIHEKKTWEGNVYYKLLLYVYTANALNDSRRRIEDFGFYFSQQGYNAISNIDHTQVANLVLADTDRLRDEANAWEYEHVIDRGWRWFQRFFSGSYTDEQLHAAYDDILTLGNYIVEPDPIQAVIDFINAGNPLVAELNDLTDVIISQPPSTGDILQYNGNEWVNVSLPTGSIPQVLDDLADVTIVTPNDNEVLTYFGGVWASAVQQLPFAVINDLDDVDTDGPQTPNDGDVLHWNNTTGHWEPENVETLITKKLWLAYEFQPELVFQNIDIPIPIVQPKSFLASGTWYQSSPMSYIDNGDFIVPENAYYSFNVQLSITEEINYVDDRRVVLSYRIDNGSTIVVQEIDSEYYIKLEDGNILFNVLWRVPLTTGDRVSIMVRGFRFGTGTVDLKVVSGFVTIDERD